MDKLHLFTEGNSTAIELPEKFTYPFNYTPHQLSLLASQALWKQLEHHDFGHDFWGKQGTGKMFGVLVIQAPNNEIGYLSAFSGKLGDGNDHGYFVPPVFDIQTTQGFYKKGEALINAISSKIESLEQSEVFKNTKKELLSTSTSATAELSAAKSAIKANKKERKRKRLAALDTLSHEVYQALEEQLKEESINEQFPYKRLAKQWKQAIAKLEEEVGTLQQEIDVLKTARKEQSNALQQKIFEHYTFLNAKSEAKSLFSIFEGTIPPGGAGECAAPKLLEYAYQHQLKPIALAEFWWGKSPNSAIRKHQHFYPSCKSKCKPILGHMLQGLEVDQNPIELQTPSAAALDLLFEDEHIIIVNKPHNFLSVPGKSEPLSIELLLDRYITSYDGPYLVHRLDFSTSGLLIAAKTKTAHQLLQQQFADKTVKKQYKAILEVCPTKQQGYIELPLRVDLDNRPQQLVCPTYGKPAKTFYKVLGTKNGQTMVHFSPITGRTHQLRVHAAHQNGLNAPIIGDDLYGTPAERLYLHAESLTFTHPISKQTIGFKSDAPFDI